jgi:hypothetical protein
MGVFVEYTKKMREMSNIKFQRSMVVEEPKVINSPHKQPVVLSKVDISTDTTVLLRFRLSVNKANDLNLLVLGRLTSHKVAKLAIVEAHDPFDFLYLLLDILVSQVDLED